MIIVRHINLITANRSPVALEPTQSRLEIAGDDGRKELDGKREWKLDTGSNFHELE